MQRYLKIPSTVENVIAPPVVEAFSTEPSTPFSLFADVPPGFSIPFPHPKNASRKGAARQNHHAGSNTDQKFLAFATASRCHYPRSNRR